jgi:hypothetical protein
MSAESIYREALESISKNTCCSTCREAATVATSALKLAEAVPSASANAGSLQLPADIVDLLKRCRTCLHPYYPGAPLLMTDLDDIIGGQQQAGA